MLQARETYLDKYKKLEPEIKELDEEVKKFRDDRAEANTPALGSRPRARVFVAIYSTIKFAFGVIIAAHPAQPQLLTSSRASLICVSFSFSYLSCTSIPVPLPLPAPPVPLSVAARREEKETLKDKRDALDKKIAEAKEDWRKYQDKVDKTNKELVNGNAYDYNKVLLALLVQKYLLYWYKSRNTDAEGAEG